MGRAAAELLGICAGWGLAWGLLSRLFTGRSRRHGGFLERWHARRRSHTHTMPRFGANNIDTAAMALIHNTITGPVDSPDANALMAVPIGMLLTALSALIVTVWFVGLVGLALVSSQRQDILD